MWYIGSPEHFDVSDYFFEIPMANFGYNFFVFHWKPHELFYKYNEVYSFYKIITYHDLKKIVPILPQNVEINVHM